MTIMFINNSTADKSSLRRVGYNLIFRFLYSHSTSRIKYVVVE